MKLVEIISGLQSSAVIAEHLCQLMQSWNKVAVKAKSTPGFIVNRVARPYYAEAFRALEEHVTAPEQLDYLMRECGGFAMGPCELTDLIGQDVNFSVTQSVYHAFFDEPRYRPSLLQQQLVDAGCYGRKSQQGFYRYHQGTMIPQYQPPSLKIAVSEQIKIVVKGAWLTCLGLIERLQQCPDVELEFEAARQDEILIDGLSLRLTRGESVELDYTQQKVVLMDWHCDWQSAKSITVTASPACSTFDLNQINMLFTALNVIPIWSRDYPGFMFYVQLRCWSMKPAKPYYTK